MLVTFLDSVQGQIAAYHLSSTPASLKAVIKGFFFTGLSLEIIGSCLAYLTAVYLQKLHTSLLTCSEIVKLMAPSLDA